MIQLLIALSVAFLTIVLLAVSVEGSTRTFAIVSLIGSLAYLTAKAIHAHRKLDELNVLRRAHEHLDQQSKLIIRTDFELHRVQEELDRRLASLMSLHQLGQQLQVSLCPDEVYKKLDAAVVTNFGFSKGLLGMCPSLEELEWYALIGVDSTVAKTLKEQLLSSGLLKQTLSNPAPRSLDMVSATDAGTRELLERLGVHGAVVAGIIAHSGPAGCLILGRASGSANAKADEELVAILTNQLAAAVANSALFEETWNSKQNLERKVRDRTHELAEANTQLKRLDKAKSDFVSAVSHELRTPLAAIKGYASLLTTGQFGDLARPQKERLAKVEKHADALTRLINDLLDIARIESGRITMERTPISVDELLGTVHDMVRPQLEEKRIQFSVDQNGVTQLIGDPQHLARVFMNLLSNAVKYTPERGKIRVGFSQEKGSILAKVTDTGCGIPKEDQPKLFQQFYRSSDPANQKIRGTGLGLALVKQIVEAHQGTIRVDSEPGQGSTFSISLPAG